MSAINPTPTGDGPLRALRVLETLGGMEQPAGLDAIAAANGLTRTKAYRVLHSLQDEGYVDHVGRSGYRVGSRSIALASRIGPRPVALQAARYVLGQLTQLSAASAGLHLRSGPHRVLVLGTDPQDSPIRSALHVGQWAPLHSGCASVVILAHLPEDEAREIARRAPPASSPPTLEDLAQVRRDGYAISFHANFPGLNGVAAPILDPVDGLALGSLSIAGVEAQMPERTLHRLSRPLMNAGGRLAPQLARLLSPHSPLRRPPLDVVIQDLAAGDPADSAADQPADLLGDTQ